MRIFRFLLVFIFVLWAASLQAVTESSLRTIAKFVEESFPPVEGFVVFVHGKRGIIDLGAKNKIYRGMVLTISRKGLPFRHPITGQILGYAEREIGVAQVIKVYSNASLIKIYAKEPVKTGDIVRITRAKINLYLLPLLDKTGEGFNLIAFSDKLKKFLYETGRFRVMSEEQVIQQVSAFGSDISELGILKSMYSIYSKKTTPFFALVGWVDKDGDNYFFRGAIICLNIAKKVKSFSIFIGKTGWRPSAERGLLFVSSMLPGRALVLASGDFDGDGAKEIVFVVQNNMYFYRFNAASRAMEFVGREKFSPSFHIFSIDAVDIDGDGKDELVISGSDYKDFIIAGWIYKYEGGKWRRILKDDEHFLRAFKVGEKVFLVRQYLTREEPLQLPPSLCIFRKGKLKEIAKLEALKGDIIIGMEMVDLDKDGKVEFIVNEDGRVVLKDSAGEVITDIPGYFGNTGVAFFYKEPITKIFYQGEGFLEISKQDYVQYKELTLTVPGRICVDPVTGELFVFRNDPFAWAAFFDPFKTSRIKKYAFRGGYFEDTGWYKMFTEGISDIYLADVNNDGKNELLVLMTKGIKTRREGLKFTSRLIIYSTSGE